MSSKITQPHEVSMQAFSRKLEWVLIFTLFFVVIGSFHIHYMLTAGDWDFWIDWKDREWWVTLSPPLSITFCAALHAFFWKNFRLPIGASFACLALLLGEWIVRIFGFHTLSYFPLNMVTPSILLAGAIALDCILLLSQSVLLTAIFGGIIYGLTFFPVNWAWVGAFHLPLEMNNQVMTVADLIGFHYIRAGTPEYIRVIERGTLRTFGQQSTTVSAFFSAFLCTLIYIMWWFIGRGFSTIKYIKDRI